jgi:predicted PolB exonuclease-like 3'-5' exonuclease
MTLVNNVLVFDIETVPDVEFGRRLHGLETLTDKQVGYVMQTRQRELTGSDFLSLEQQRIVAISIAMRTRDGFKVWSLGDPDSPEEELVRRFFDGIERLAPTLVSWNGSGFDLPVLHYRALRHKVQAHRYWEMGDMDPSYKRSCLGSPESSACQAKASGTPTSKGAVATSATTAKPTSSTPTSSTCGSSSCAVD